ncbi:MAG TPA: hypothetical protein VKA34_18390 [Balneolales bacterium]|nr:hypothetical protein [Balneolales bacterium]
MNLKYVFKFFLLSIVFWGVNVQAQSKNQQLAHEILTNPDFTKVLQKGDSLLSSGFNAGSGYQQVWIRDFNTFINNSLRVLPKSTVRSALLKFFYFQGFDGNMVDGYEQIGPNAKIDNYGRFTRYDMPGYAFHKNTVETDQESSLVQAVYKYIRITKDTTILAVTVHGHTVQDRLDRALQYLMNFRFDKKYGLIWGATTADWGDVQPLGKWGVKYDENSQPAIDIYDNAMFVIALRDFIEMSHNPAQKTKWRKIYREVKTNVHKYLWDQKHLKFRPHVYIQNDPFHGFNENKIYYHGGTAVAIKAGLLSRKQVLEAYRKMESDVREAGAQTIGLTMYPAYPKGSFQNPGMGPYSYQNGGDWTWFGARMITDLVRYGFVKQAYRAIQPMVHRVIKNKGFYEWYTVSGKPQGSAKFKGSAGELMEAIESLQHWAKRHQ